MKKITSKTKPVRITSTLAEKIRTKYYYEDVTFTDLSKEFGICINRISDIIHNRICPSWESYDPYNIFYDQVGNPFIDLDD